MILIAITIIAALTAVTVMVVLGKPIKIEFHKTITVHNVDNYSTDKPTLTQEELKKLQDKLDEDTKKSEEAKSLEGVIQSINEIFGVPTGNKLKDNKGE